MGDTKMKEIDRMIELNAKIQANIEMQMMLLEKCIEIITEVKGEKE